jgi:hypothetical protein
MDSNEIFDSAVRSAGDLAGVFEYDGETSYFYLYETEGAEGQRVIDSIHVQSGSPDFGPEDIVVRWNTTEDKVGLFIRDLLWAVFDGDGRRKYGGNYKPGAAPPSLPPGVAGGF